MNFMKWLEKSYIVEYIYIFIMAPTEVCLFESHFYSSCTSIVVIEKPHQAIW